jgi:hypothetical protein
MISLLATVVGSLIAALLAAAAFNFMGNRLARREQDSSINRKTA